MLNKIDNIVIDNHVVSYRIHQPQSPEGTQETTKKLDLNKFQFLWAVADYVDWENNTKNYRLTQDILKKSLNQEQAEQLRFELDQVKGMLDDLLFTDLYPASREFFGGDDSFNDMLDHIVSLGKYFVADIAANKEQAWDYLREHPPVEAFSYALPYAHEYESEPNYDKQAQEALEEMEDKISVLQKDTCLKEDYKERVIEQALTLATPLRHIATGHDELIENLDMSIINSSLKDFKNMARMAHNAIELMQDEPEFAEKDYWSSSLIGYEAVNIPNNYLSDKKAAKKVQQQKVDFSKFDEQYRKQHKNWTNTS